MVVAVVIAWAVALPRLVPSTFGDHGTYASVAERLIAGDRLYVDVWDNKDPLFYYALALGRLVSPLADVALEILWVVGRGSPCSSSRSPPAPTAGSRSWPASAPRRCS